MKRVIPYGHELLKEMVCFEDITVDMTAGNGHDTLFLSTISHKVYSFDIQDQAIKNTQELLTKNNVENVELILDSHEAVGNYINTPIGGAIFNLGYLPGSDKVITTKYETTIKAINNLLPLLKKNGICIIIVYPGHEEGLIESIHLDDYLSELSQDDYIVLKYQYINQINNPPYLLSILKK